jgi:hypothetical protein
MLTKSEQTDIELAPARSRVASCSTPALHPPAGGTIPTWRRMIHLMQRLSSNFIYTSSTRQFCYTALKAARNHVFPAPVTVRQEAPSTCICTTPCRCLELDWLPVLTGPARSQPDCTWAAGLALCNTRMRIGLLCVISDFVAHMSTRFQLDSESQRQV